MKLRSKQREKVAKKTQECHEPAHTPIVFLLDEAVKFDVAEASFAESVKSVTAPLDGRAVA